MQCLLLRCSMGRFACSGFMPQRGLCTLSLVWSLTLGSSWPGLSPGSSGCSASRSTKFPKLRPPPPSPPGGRISGLLVVEMALSLVLSLGFQPSWPSAILIFRRVCPGFPSGSSIRVHHGQDLLSGLPPGLLSG